MKGPFLDSDKNVMIHHPIATFKQEGGLLWAQTQTWVQWRTQDLSISNTDLARFIKFLKNHLILRPSLWCFQQQHVFLQDKFWKYYVSVKYNNRRNKRGVGVGSIIFLHTSISYHLFVVHCLCIFAHLQKYYL